MTKMKKISKIIPAVLLSGAMVVPVSQLTSPVVAHAYGNSAYTQKAIDYTPTITRLVDAELNSPQSRSIQRNNSSDVVVPTNGEITVNLEGKDYHEFNAKLAVPKEDNSSIRYRVYLDDDRQIRDISIKPGEEKDLHVELFGDDAKELKIVATSSSNARSNNTGLVENGTFTTYYTDYFKIDEKSCPSVWSDYQRASYDSAYIGTRDHLNPLYLRANKPVTFGTYSNIYLNGNPILGCNPILVNNGYTVNSKTNQRVEAYGIDCKTYTLGVRIMYNVKELTLVRQLHDGNGNIFRSCAVKAKVFTPVSQTERYKSVKTTEI